MSALLVGYARCSTRGQDLRAQKSALRQAGVAADRIYTDVGYSGRSTDRPGLHLALAAAREGDTLVVTKLDHLGRSILDLHRIANQLTDKGVRLSWSGTTYNPADPAGRLFFSMLAAFAEFESDIIRSRTIEGMAEARRQGRIPGRKSKLTRLQQRRLYEDYESGNYTAAELMEMYPLKRSALYATIQRERECRDLAGVTDASFGEAPRVG
ncbi:recombinase family protein [Gordonia liuliyuniae]|uniref:Recombinase family protein n=1 Tax=Gordonia liuliyuniae TaxID=2911517 RepID=A0ABS9INM2_9ACTN|nr:recombinase family protein [Gordonia liuliyuniae]MCF8587150.1 recombinase family protein [Gordonia liuliyuniae]